MINSQWKIHFLVNNQLRIFLETIPSRGPGGGGMINYSCADVCPSILSRAREMSETQ